MNSKAAAYQQQTDKTQLVERHAPLVKRIAHHLMARLPASVLVDDLIQAGMIGLLEAARNFDGSKGASFEKYEKSMSFCRQHIIVDRTVAHAGCAKSFAWFERQRRV